LLGGFANTRSLLLTRLSWCARGVLKERAKSEWPGVLPYLIDLRLRLVIRGNSPGQKRLDAKPGPHIHASAFSTCAGGFPLALWDRIEYSTKVTKMVAMKTSVILEVRCIG
jgi:hypothetical protein